MNIRELKLFVLLLGFLGGNLFGTTLDCLRSFFVWDGLIIATLIVVSEVVSYLAYKPYSNFLRSDAFLFYEKKEGRIATSLLNFFKIGVMIGFFVDAFKVGS